MLSSQTNVCKFPFDKLKLNLKRLELRFIFFVAENIVEARTPRIKLVSIGFAICITTRSENTINSF